jgi:hypothetical protein
LNRSVALRNVLLRSVAGWARGGNAPLNQLQMNSSMNQPSSIFRRWRLSGVGLVFLILMAMQGTAMAKMVIFSAVSGKVLHDGKPVAGALIEREWKWAWKDEAGADRVITAPDGSFSLPMVERSSLLGSLLPHTPSVRQTILIKHAGTTYKAWMFDKEEYANNGELKGKPIRITCRLENQPSRHGDVFGICEPE